MQPRNLAVLGSTGSIGKSTLDVVGRHPDRFRVFALTAHRQAELLVDQCRRFRPRYAVITDPQLQASVGEALRGTDTTVLSGADALDRVASAPEVDVVMAAIVGAAGLASSLAAARAGKCILLANKEALVMAGPVFMEAAEQSGAVLLPIDSEHNAIFQCLPHNAAKPPKGVRRIMLTGSGGPFRTTPVADLRHVTPAQACAHPNWVMGKKISVDSATMMNKALEVIEAHWLFGVAPAQIEVLIHPQSVVHSMVEYEDGSVLAQLGNPDMRTPIAHALAYPERIESGVARLDLAALAKLTFEAPDFQRFPALKLAYRVLAAGGNAPATLNAANEYAVGAFLDGNLPFDRIAALIEAVAEATPVQPVTTLSQVLAADGAARGLAQSLHQGAMAQNAKQVA
jgi:1-deoxy-D-xylulose-5-phosphate reductoisomerase